MPTDNQPNPHADFVRFLNAVGNVHADRVNPAFKSKYASLAEVLETVKPVAQKHNLALAQTATSEEGKVCVTTTFIHLTGHVFNQGMLSFKSDGLSPQQVGSAITYLRRQSIQTACGISTDLDDDGASASIPPRGPLTKPADAPATPRPLTVR